MFAERSLPKYEEQKTGDDLKHDHLPELAARDRGAITGYVKELRRSLDNKMVAQVVRKARMGEKSALQNAE